MAKVFTITEGLENMGAMKTGGQGSVYKGRRMGEIITAIKLMPTPIFSESADDKNFTAFQNEVLKLQKVNEEPCPNVVKILSSGITESGNFPYIEMEFIEGPDLEELLKPPHERVFTIKEVIKVADQLSRALAHCHKTDVKHGDIKSNNVKFDVRTGNYVLLDFGLAIMSDEQRRTSMRQAGAIEFMAPEQNEGLMLFQTDIYSFGVILFELLAGTVPFPLNDKSETGRNNVMISHIEKLPPDLLPVRRLAMPGDWSAEKKEQEMKVPGWLMSLVYKCLEKKPEDRFENGLALHDYVWQNAIQAANSTSSNERIAFLEEENKTLRLERNQLLQQLEQHAVALTKTGKRTSNALNKQEFTDRKPSIFGTVVRRLPNAVKIGSLAFTVVVLSAALYVFIRSNNSKNAFGNAQPGKQKAVGEYFVISPKAYFYNQPDENTRRNAYAVPGSKSLNAYGEKNNFIYTEITNENGQTSKGWLRRQDVITAKEWGENNAAIGTSASDNEAVQAQLRQAKQFLNQQKTAEALVIYSTYSARQVPEAMYQYAKLALQNKNGNISCAEAFRLLESAAGKGCIPAKRTLGFLYIYAQDKETLTQSNFYERCVFSKNIRMGSKLLMEAMLKGDTTAARLLDVLNKKPG